MFILLFTLAVVLSGVTKDDAYFERRTQQFSEMLRAKENKALRYLQEVELGLESDSSHIFSTLQQRFAPVWDQEGIALYAYQNDALVFWSSSYIPMPSYSFDEDFLFKVIKLKNGWYRLVKHQHDDIMLIGLILLKNEYFINNEFLVDHFQRDFKLDAAAGITVDSLQTIHRIYDKNQQFLFGLHYSEEQEHQLLYAKTAGALYLAALLAFLFVLYNLRYLDFFKRYPVRHIAVFATAVFGLRSINIAYKWPGVLYELPLFDPQHFASSSWLPSLGDFILNTLLFTALLGLMYQNLLTYRAKWVSRLHITFWLVLLGSVAAAFSLAIHGLFRSLIFDSRISFDLANILDLNTYSFLGFGLISVLLITYLIIIHFCARILMRNRKLHLLVAALWSLLPFAVSTFTGYVVWGWDVFGLFFPYIIYVTILAAHYSRRRVFNFYTFAPAIFMFTLFATYMLFRLNGEKEIEQRKVLAFKIAEEQDHVAEYLFIGIEDKLQQDPVVRSYLFANDNLYPYEFFERIAQRYFSGYWSKYALVITPFSIDDYAYIDDSLRADPELLYFENAIRTHGKQTASPHLYYIDNNFGKVNYVARIEMTQPDRAGNLQRKYIFIEFISKMVTQVTGFPELLLDESITRPVQLGGYSYATYKNQKLNVSGGDYVYPLEALEFKPNNEELTFINIREYNHLIYTTPSGKIIVMSRRNPKFQDFLNPFAYLLIFFSFILFLFFTYRYYFSNENKKLQFNFKTRIQLSILVILLVSLVVVGLGINDYVITQFDRKNKATINEKLSSILLELRGEMEEGGVWDREYLNYLLARLSNIFFTDINLYDPKGTLIASSRESIYNEGLIARQMDPEAFKELSEKRQFTFLHEEKIGNFKYLTAYATFRGPENEVIGYLNLPYFLRQKDLKEELSASLLALINIYSLLIAVSMIVTFLIANRLTGPLTVLQEKIGQLRLGRKNEIIEYKANDEIGSLVSEYNRMIRELEKSADLLARSERESAWREMAKQVAHEVKNPLTPMKLSVQYLLKAWEDKRPDFDERLRKFKDAMIEQIETLSTIASEFSYFAKMPAARKMEINLLEIMQNCIEFFKNNESNVQVVIQPSSVEQAIIHADRDQILRVFNNLIRNAIQAIPEDRNGLITLVIQRQGDEYVVKVKDNGSGIPEDIREKIFAPNFTTKSSGMGLGLAMTKTIIENLDGEISYTTSDGEGTTFIIRIPALR